MDTKLIKRLEKIHAETIDLLVNIRAGYYRDNCTCGSGGTCEYHSYTHNLLRDYKRQLQAEIGRLYDGQRSGNGDTGETDPDPYKQDQCYDCTHHAAFDCRDCEKNKGG